MDVFAKLNSFLDKVQSTEDDSFVYEAVDSPTTTSTGKGNIVDSIDLCNFLPEEPTRAKRGGRKKTSRKPDEAFDLTDGSFEVSPPKRSRRAADALPASEIATVDLLDNNGNKTGSSQASSQESLDDSNTGMKTRRTRDRPKKITSKSKKITPKPKAAPKPKRLTLKQALAIVTAPVPKPSETSTRKPSKSPVPVPVAPPPVASTSNAVDLTGDICFQENHSRAPLFHKQVAIATIDDELDDFDDDEVESIRVKVKIRQAIKAFPYRLHQKFYDLYKIISEKESIPISNIFLYDGDKRVHQDDTPHSAKYRISTILTCHVMEGVDKTLTKLAKKDEIELKFQSDKWKKPIALKMSKMDSFKTAIEILCEQLEFKPHQVSLYFDGDAVVLGETPIDLDFDGGEILDCRIRA